jgi:hypothetical protein
MLHIITPLYRYENLTQLFSSIYANDDITWHIAHSNKKPLPELEFLKSKNIKIYSVDCLDTDATSKRNEVLKNIKNGYFCFLDDDTIFHENMYMKYRECVDHNFVGMIIGEQIDNDGKLRLVASKPVFRRIDTGNVLCHHSCLSECEWPSEYIPEVNQKDFLFWDSVYNYYNKKCGIWNQPISYYNKLSKIENDNKKKTKSNK